jgi:hypothetical protein
VDIRSKENPDMNLSFVIGYFSGALSWIALAYYLVLRDRKRQKKQAETFVKGMVNKVRTWEKDNLILILEGQLKSAIEREDYKEAARLRDKISQI